MITFCVVITAAFSVVITLLLIEIRDILIDINGKVHIPVTIEE
jgi:hypothetical protein